MNKEKENKKKEKILKSSFFLKLFGIPSVIWVIISIIIMIPEDTSPNPLTWGDITLIDIIILLIWFAISFIISLIINEVKKLYLKRKDFKDIQYVTKAPEKVIVNSNEEDKSKEEVKLKTNSKCLYVCESKIDSYEYKKMVRYFPQFYWTYVILGTILNLIISSVVTIVFKNVIGTLIFFCASQIYLMILYKIRLENFAEKSFNLAHKEGNTEIEFHTEFYDDYFTRQGEVETYKINYNDIDKCIETDTNFYLKFNKISKIIIIQKNLCDLELISFIRKKFKGLENNLGDNSTFKRTKKYHNQNFIKIFMVILFIITIYSLWGALWSLNLVEKINPQHGVNFIKNAWVFWCWLPIPILSIVLGFKYKNAGFKCTKNIVGGFIVGFLLLIYGSFSLMPTSEEDYSKIDEYKNFIDADLPTNGELEIQDYGISFDEDKTNYTIISAYYDKEDVSNLVRSIENNNNWILSKKIKSELKIFIPSQLKSDDDAYFSIYNKTTNQYNTLPELSGNYEIYVIKYDISDKQLEIHKFNFDYN